MLKDPLLVITPMQDIPNGLSRNNGVLAITPETEIIGMGGGCHWCTEAVFLALHGVKAVEQGFIRSDGLEATYSEAVKVTFNSGEISLQILIEIHLRTHSCTSQHPFRKKYRSAIYVFSEEQRISCAAALSSLQPEFDDKIITQVLPFIEFQKSREKYQRYYEKGPERPFCQRYIDPKLDLLRNEYGRLLHPPD